MEDKTKVENTVNPDFTYDEIQNQSIRDIRENKPAPVIEKKEEEKIPPDDIKKEIEESITKKLAEEREAEKVAELKAQEEKEAKVEVPVVEDKPEHLAMQQEIEKEYLSFQDEFTKKNGRPPNWVELAVYADEKKLDKVIDLYEKKQEAKKAEVEKKTQEQEEVRKQEQKVLEEHVNEELTLLYNSNKLTKIIEPNNPDDPGVRERMDFFKQWADVNNARRAEGKKEIISASAIHQFFYKPVNRQPAGIDAPVMGNRGSAVAPSDERTIDYAKDIAGKPWSYFKRNK